MDSVTIRASSLSSLFDCPAQWAAKHIDGIKMPRSPRSLIGNAVHESAAAYDAARMENTGITINEAAGVIVDYINNYQDDVEWIGLTRRDVERKAIQIHERYCAEISPRFNFVLAEVRCTPIDLAIDGLKITLTGTVDRVYKSVFEEYGGLDLKTGYAAINASGQVETIKHIPQTGIYTVLIENEYGIELKEDFVIAGMSTAGEVPAIGLGMIPNAKQHLLGDPENGIKGLLDYAVPILKSGSFYGNPASMTCTKQYCPIYNTCKFRGKLS